ncbi:hypothetical protein M422DRAFT_22862 [Sphaerobolus stellatus SS14]|nr:hypothetical protein M422DRAFT_22862 [Sphaerobolus stellatus SS14]
MRYVALLSGGKDSCFNLLHCAKNGHELVAAASLGPGQGKGETDSYMYQTVGQDAIEFVAQALEVPLIRRVITGQAINQGAEYGSRLSLDPRGVQGDETEDLFELLSEVKAAFPDIQGVSVGAILSNYQRVRVEHVCQRLSLTPLCYLWQRNQSDLLNEMIESGLEAVLIKVAGIGLTTKHLGKTLGDMRPTLLKLNTLYGSHVCGEGGEYESLTLNSPLFKHKIILDDVETIIHSDNDFATVAYLRIRKAHLERKNEPVPDIMHLVSSRLSEDRDEDEDGVKQIVLDAQAQAQGLASTQSVTADRTSLFDTNTMSTTRVGSWVTISNVQKNVDRFMTLEEEVRCCFDTVQGELNKFGLNMSNIANVILLISSMDDFSIVNTVYGSYFGTSPPARACVSADLPSNIRVRLECITNDASTPYSRRALHVQSLSYWAPANIGPYSQAITTGGRIYISGQIGLIPANNTLPSPKSLSQELALSLRHVHRIVEVVKESSAAYKNAAIQGLITWLAHPEDLIPVQRGMEASESIDISRIPTLFTAVKSLPKGALVETQVLLHTAQKDIVDDDDDDSSTDHFAEFSQGDLIGLNTHWESSSVQDLHAFVTVIACKNEDDLVSLTRQLSEIPTLSKLWKSTTAVRLFHTPAADINVLHLFNLLFEQNGIKSPSLMDIPSRIIATRDRSNWDYALFFIG